MILSNGTVKTILEAIFLQWNGFHYEDDITTNSIDGEEEENQALAENERTTAFINATLEDLRHRRRIKTEDKAEVVAVIWGTYLNAALTI